MENYKEKYLKYKNKYLQLKIQFAGTQNSETSPATTATHAADADDLYPVDIRDEFRRFISDYGEEFANLWSGDYISSVNSVNTIKRLRNAAKLPVNPSKNINNDFKYRIEDQNVLHPSNII